MALVGQNMRERLPHAVATISPYSLASDITQICKVKYLISSLVTSRRSCGNFPLKTGGGQIYTLP